MSNKLKKIINSVSYKYKFGTQKQREQVGEIIGNWDSERSYKKIKTTKKFNN